MGISSRRDGIYGVAATSTIWLDFRGQTALPNTARFKSQSYAGSLQEYIHNSRGTHALFSTSLATNAKTPVFHAIPLNLIVEYVELNIKPIDLDLLALTSGLG